MTKKSAALKLVLALGVPLLIYEAIWSEDLATEVDKDTLPPETTELRHFNPEKSFHGEQHEVVSEAVAEIDAAPQSKNLAMDQASIYFEAKKYFQVVDSCEDCRIDTLSEADHAFDRNNAKQMLMEDWKHTLGSINGTLVRQDNAPELRRIEGIKVSELEGISKPFGRE